MFLIVIFEVQIGTGKAVLVITIDFALMHY